MSYKTCQQNLKHINAWHTMAICLFNC